jgi:hypothetical protein
MLLGINAAPLYIVTISVEVLMSHRSLVFPGFRNPVGLFGWGSARRKTCIYSGQHEYIHAPSGIRTHNISVRSMKDSQL